MSITSNELRQKYLDFFHKRGHIIIPSESLVPENDPTTLFTGSGMQPLVPYLLGKVHPQGTRLVDSQKAFRSVDIEEVGDNRHTTFFEMLGNWSLGDYFKKDQLLWIFEFLTKELQLNPQKLFVTVFRGDPKYDLSKDTESVEIWKSLFNSVGIEAKDVDFSEEKGLQGGRIFYYEGKKNWWSRSGTPEQMPVDEPGGGTSEIFYDFGPELQFHEKSSFKDQPCHVNCDCGRFLEIGNSVFMEYKKTETGLEKLQKQNVDFGGGLERILAVIHNSSDVFETDLFTSIIKKLESLSGKKYEGYEHQKRPFRIVADHMRAATMLAADGVYPSNKDQGYFSRRLLRRAILYGKKLGIEDVFISSLVDPVVELYQTEYPEVAKSRETIKKYFEEEEEKFRKTLERGLAVLESMNITDTLSGKAAFDLYQTYGFPIELTVEVAKEKGFDVDVDGFEKEKKKHQELSRQGAEQKFAGGLADHSEETTKLHTATHLLHQALRNVLGSHVQQRGSNITEKRLRFDFSHSEKLTEQQKQQIEDEVNGIIKKDLPVTMEMTTVDDAKKQGALALFEDKYEDKVKLYKVGDYSVEVCGGPHVEHTGLLGTFKIKKEESVGRGLRRIKAVLV